MIDISLSIRRVALVGVTAVAIITACYLATQYYRVKIASPKLQAAMAAPEWPTDAAAQQKMRERIVNPRGIVQLFDMDAEGNIPAIYSVVQLILAAVLLFVIARHHRANGDAGVMLWTVLAFGFLFLALDEGGSIHSSFYLSNSSEAARKARGVFYFSWIIPALIGVAAVVLLYLRFWWRLPARTRVLFLVAGAWFVGSAVGGEMAQGWWTAHGYSKTRLGFAAMTIVEECGEMLSILLFICAQLDYLRLQKVSLKLSVAPEQARVARAKPAAVREPSLADIDPDEAESLIPR